VFLIASSKGKPTLDAAHLPPDRIARVVDIDRPNDHKGGVVLWYRGGDAIWGLEGPSGAGIADAYDATDGRVCVSFWLSREQTLDVDGTRKTLGRAKMNTAHVGCFSVPIAAKPDAAPGP
jgi:hypothetical protein